MHAIKLSVVGGREAPLCVSDSCCLFITLIIFPGKNDYEPLDNFDHACMKPMNFVFNKINKHDV